MKRWLTLTIPSTLDSSRYALAIHTASADFGLALSNFADQQRCQTWQLGRDVSNYLHLHLAQFLQPQSWSDLAFLAVAKGPGGFTGTRLGVVTARTLAQQLDLPLFPVSTLAAVAWSEYRAGRIAGSLDASESAFPDIAVEMPAHRGEIHGAIYGLETLEPLEPLLSNPDPTLTLGVRAADAVYTPDQWQQILAGWPCPYHRVQAENNLGGTVLALLELAYREWQRGQRPNWSEALPVYGQSPV